MTDFSGEASRSLHQSAIHYDAASNARTHRDSNHQRPVLACSFPSFCEREAPRIIVERDRELHSIAKHCQQRNVAGIGDIGQHKNRAVVSHQAGNANANAIWARVIPANFLANETAWGAILLKSDRDTQIGFNFAQSLVAGVVDLKAGQWVRLLVSNHNYTGATRFGSIALWPVAADQPVLRLAQPIGLRSPSGQIARQLSASVRQPPSVGPMTGPNTEPRPHSAIALPCSSGG